MIRQRVRSIPEVQTETYDLAIVGAGIAGGLIATRLARAGARVVILEAGPRVDRNEGVELYRAAVAKSPESPYPGTFWAPRPDVLDLDHYYVQSGPEKFRSTYIRRVGGTTWHWLGSWIRLLPSDFEMRRRFGVGVDWPLSYAELEPWYGQAEVEIGVAGDNAFDLGAPRSGPYPMPPIPLTYGDGVMGRAAAAVGLRIEATPQARNSVPYQGRPQCCGNAMCIPICPIGAKYDGAAHITLAEGLGVKVIENAVASRIEVDAAGQVTAIIYKTPGNAERSVTARRYVVAANAIETAKLLLISRSGALSTGVANSSDLVGRHLSDHPVKLSIAAANEPVYPYRSPLATAGIEQTRASDRRDERSGYRIEIGNDGWSWPGLDPLGVAQGLITQGIVGEELFRLLGERIPHQVRLGSLCEQIPNPENRVVPDESATDDLGLPRPRLSYRIDPYTQFGLDDAQATHDRLFDALGVSFRQHIDGFQGAGHLMGTHRMGTDPATSVTDADGRSHDHPNLFLAGAGLFPTTGTANPTATLAALALRTAAVITGELGAAATARLMASPTGSS